MAQFFYDLSIAVPGQWPVFAMRTGSAPSTTNGKRAISRADGFLVVDKDEANVWDFVPFGHDVSDVDLLLKMQRRRVNSTLYVNTGNGIFLRGGGDSSGYYVGLGSVTTSSSTTVHRVACVYRRHVGSGQTKLAEFDALPTRSPRSDMMRFASFLRVQMIGSRLKAKAWWEDAPEPIEWQVDLTDATYASGDIGILIQGYDSLTDLHFLSMGTDGDPAPFSYPGGPRYVARTVLNPDGSPAEGKVVRCYTRDGGVLLQEQVTNSGGHVLFELTYPDEVYVIAIDQDGNTWNGIIHDMVLPFQGGG